MDISDDKLGVTVCPWCNGELFAGRHTNPDAECPGPPKPQRSRWPEDLPTADELADMAWEDYEEDKRRRGMK